MAQRTEYRAATAELHPTPIDKAVQTQLFANTAFLYSGASPIQTGVLPGTIQEDRVAVIRGHVVDRFANSVSGVRVTIEGHPEFGETGSRIDDYFDMAVNGGTTLVMNYELTGYLPIQRRVEAGWQ